MKTCDVLASGSIELYFYGELDARARTEVAGHLTGCGVCREALDEMSVIRDALAACPDVSAPASGDWAPFMSRLDAAIAKEAPAAPAVVAFPAARLRARVSYAGYFAMAALLTLVTASVLFVARPRDASVPQVTDAPIVAGDRVQPEIDPQLVSASGRHFERSKLVVLDLATKNTADVTDWDYERELAEGLLNDTRLYRITAEQRGMTKLAGVLRDLEIVLLQTSMTDEKDPEAVAQIQRLIQKRDLVEQMDAVTTASN